MINEKHVKVIKNKNSKHIINIISIKELINDIPNSFSSLNLVTISPFLFNFKYFKT